MHQALPRHARARDQPPAATGDPQHHCRSGNLHTPAARAFQTSQRERGTSGPPCTTALSRNQRPFARRSAVHPLQQDAPGKADASNTVGGDGRTPTSKTQQWPSGRRRGIIRALPRHASACGQPLGGTHAPSHGALPAGAGLSLQQRDARQAKPTRPTPVAATGERPHPRHSRCPRQPASRALASRSGSHPLLQRALLRRHLQSIAREATAQVQARCAEGGLTLASGWALSRVHGGTRLKGRCTPGRLRRPAVLPR